MDMDNLKAWMKLKGYSTDGIQRVEKATLPGFRLVWNYYSNARSGGAANIEPSNRDLPGVAFEVDADTLKAIDRKEGHPRVYSRGDTLRTIGLESGEEIKAWVYIVLPSRCQKTPVRPRREYLQILVRAAKLHGLPSWHILELERTPTQD
ncbi:MAG: gamma-glutamylcyclotransferase [Nitrospirae bacterium]|nr:gamma-glutamylcyclotransferase [Nitrospirota bacterium]